MYEFAKGPIPEGKLVCHTCDTPLCINPDHLFIGTNADNIQDCVKKGRAARAKGSRNGNAKFDEGQVIEIKVLLNQGNSRRKIAREFGVAHQTVNAINTGKTWGWLK